MSFITELSLEKIHNRLLCEHRRKLKHYEELFVPGFLEFIDIRYFHPSLYPTRKILLKGNPGMGKTSFSKKVAYDWGQGNFIRVNLILFVFLKLVKPNDSIDDAIMQQNPVLQANCVTKQKVVNVLEQFGRQCLLILDGFE